MSAAPVVVKISSPADIVASLPHFVGFHPQESLVVMSLRGPRKRSGLTARVDLPAPEEHAGLAAHVARSMVRDGASAALVVVYTDAPDDDGALPRRDLVDRQVEELLCAGVGVLDAFLVRRGRWWCYDCTEGCCPSDGTPLPERPTGAAAHVAAEAALEGTVVLRDRAELEALVRGPQALRRAALQGLYEETLPAYTGAFATDPLLVGSATCVLLQDMVRRRAAGDVHIDDEDALHVLLGLTSKSCRDRAMTWALEDDATSLQDVLAALARLAVDDVCAPVCTVLAAVAYAEGRGALANVALDRALAADPHYTMAQLIRQSLDQQIPPAGWRSTLRSTADVLDGVDVVRRRSGRGGLAGRRRRGPRRRAAGRRRAQHR